MTLSGIITMKHNALKCREKYDPTLIENVKEVDCLLNKINGLNDLFP